MIGKAGPKKGKQQQTGKRKNGRDIKIKNKAGEFVLSVSAPALPYSL